jgi:transmembrane sensor
MKNSTDHNTAFDSAGGTPGGAERTVLDWPRHSGTVGRLLPLIESRVRRRRRRRLGAVAAGLALLLVAAVVWPGRPVPLANQPVAAAAGPLVLPNTQVLSDGSVVQLREGAEIAVAFEDGYRRVILKKGEAHFQVTKNPRRPFIVVAAGVEVRAVGTAFGVQLGNQAVEVLVTEGRVAVDHSAAPAAETAEPLAVLDAGTHVTIGTAPDPESKPAVSVLTPEQIDERMAWRVPRLDLSGTPLDEVIALFSRYGHANFVLADPALGRLRLTGVLRVDHPELLVRVVERDLGIRAERRASGEILLFKAR